MKSCKRVSLVSLAALVAVLVPPLAASGASQERLEPTSKDGDAPSQTESRPTVRFEGTVQADGRFVDSTLGDTRSFIVRRANGGIGGTWGELAEYRFVIEISSAEPSSGFSPRKLALNDGYVGLVFSSALRLRAGQFILPFETEFSQIGNKQTDLAERSWVQRLTPGRDIGVMLTGELFEKRADYAIGVFNGASGESAGKNSVDTNAEKDLVAQLRLRPMASAPHALRNLQLGGGYTAGGSSGDPVTAITSGETGIRMLGPASDVTGGPHRKRWSTELYWWGGPFSLKAALATLDLDLVRATRTERARQRAFQIGGSWLLTGESKTLGRITPRHDFDWRRHTWGSLELAARFSGWEAGSVFEGAPEERFADPLFNTDRVRSVAVGLTWRPHAMSRLLVDYVRETYRGAFRKPGGEAPGSRASAVLTRLQVDF